MKYQDELLAVYPSKNPATRKFLLAQLMDHAQDRFASDLVDLLRIELSSPDPLVMRQARYTLGQLLPIVRALGDEPAAPPRGVSAARVALAPVTRRLEQVLATGDPGARVTASLALGRIADAASRDRLLARLAASTDFNTAAALAELGGPDVAAALESLARRRSGELPDLYMLFRELDYPERLPFLAEAEATASSHARASIAFALGHTPTAESRDLLARLLHRKEGWVTAYVLEALAGSAEPEDFPLIRLAYEQDAQEFNRTLAVRAAGLVRSPEAAEFCRAILDAGPGRMQSVALKALCEQGHDLTPLLPAARAMLDGTFLRNRVQAMLALAQGDPEWNAEPLYALLLSNEPLLRMEAAYVLGAAQPGDSASLLDLMAGDDPSEQVRVQAVRGLAAHPPDAALGPLVRALASEHAAVARAASRALATFPRAAAAQAVEQVSAAAADFAAPGARAAAWRALGPLAAAAGVAAPPGLLAALHSDAFEEVAAALDALPALGDAVPADALRPLIGHADPRLSARAAVAALAAGELEPALALAAALAGDDDRSVREAAEATLSIALLVPDQLGQPRFGRMTRALAPRGGHAALGLRGALAGEGTLGGVTHRDALAPASDPDASRAAALHERDAAPASSGASAASNSASSDDASASEGLQSIPMPPSIEGDEPVQHARRTGPRRAAVTRALAAPVRPMTRAMAAPAALDAGRSYSERVSTKQLAANTSSPSGWLTAGSRAPGERSVPTRVPTQKIAVAAGSAPAAGPPTGRIVAAVAALAAVAVLAFVLYPRGAPPPSAESILARQLPRVLEAEGPCTCAAPGAEPVAVRPGEQLLPGALLATGPRARLRLQDRLGNFVDLAADSHATVALADGGDVSGQVLPWTIEEPGGECRFDLERAKQASIRIQSMHLLARSARFVTRDTPDGPQVVLQTGEAALVTGNGQRRPLTPGTPALVR